MSNFAYGSGLMWHSDDAQLRRVQEIAPEVTLFILDEGDEMLDVTPGASFACAFRDGAGLYRSDRVLIVLVQSGSVSFSLGCRI